MTRISELGIDLNKNLDFISDTRLNVETLRAEEEKLQDDRRSFNPFKPILNYRASRLFHAAAKTVFLRTKSKSETIHRDAGKERVQVVPSTQMQLVDGKLVQYRRTQQ
ncbi:hypothetical protein L210DRAFT_76352 [Boletus edulis BED1]|uniref:Uncharacterized protein n=1 Tax=Boletus edulis BED1 TaxID=1328754 RepID=A0AAD4C0R7_BOLED|nr:hypothetical protein L210DRAFT_76352 [Boletus edulis BED1]